MDIQHSVVVVFAADDKYCGPLGVSILSLLEHRAQSTVLELYILDGGLSPKSKEFLNEMAGGFGCQLIFVSVDVMKVASLPTQANLNATSYLRLFIPDLLPVTLTKAIYLDCDIIVLSDLQPIWEIELADTPIAAVEAPGVNNSPTLAYVKPQLNMLESDIYFNSGIVLLNLDHWRRQSICEKAIDYALLYQERLVMCAQDVLNVIFRNNWHALPLYWNQQSFMHKLPLEYVAPEKRSEWIQALTNPAIIHFTAQPKPWEPGCVHPAQGVFKSYKDRTRELWENEGRQTANFKSRTGLHKIVAVAMVKNEEDIIESFVLHHCNILDGLYIIDNNSRDSTRIILRRLQMDGLHIVILDDVDFSYSQAMKMTFIAQQVLDTENADFVLLLDADEFVVTTNGDGNPRTILEDLPTDKLNCIKWRTYVPYPTDDHNELHVPRRLCHIRDEKAEQSWKVILPKCLAHNHAWSVWKGNHGISADPTHLPGLEEQLVESLRLAHYPVRSVNQYKKKMLTGWINRFSEWPINPGASIQFEIEFRRIKSEKLIDANMLMDAATGYSLPHTADTISVSHFQHTDRDLLGIILKYTPRSDKSWLKMFLSSCESLVLKHVSLQITNRQLQNSLWQANNDNAIMREEKSAALARYNSTRQQLDAVLGSRSWRVAATLRSFFYFFRRLIR